MFAKLYETELGQILVKLDSNDECCPEVRYYFEPEGLGVCSSAAVWSDTDDGWDSAEEVFEAVTMESAISTVSQQLEFIKDKFPSSDE